MASRSWRSSESLPRKRPYSPPESPTRTTRMRNAVHNDVLFEQGIYPTHATFSARGSHAISCFRDGFARVWNVDPLHTRFLDCEHVLEHAETVYRAAISDCGTRAVTTAGDGVARVWELAKTDRPCREIATQYRSTRSCDISSDGNFVAATFYTGKKNPLSRFQGTVVLYDPIHGVEVYRNSIAGVPDKVRVSRNGRIVAVGCYGVTPARIMARDTRLTLFTADGKMKYFFPGCFEDEDSCVAWDLSDNGSYVAICAQNRSVIELYTELAPMQWASHPTVLRAAAPLIYEMVRIVENGDLVSAVALDKITKERSILVFRPSSGDVLFSLACGLKDPKSCVDLEPRVCYALGTYEEEERKVVRLLSRTGGESASLKLVRCGDPPKSPVHSNSMKSNSAPQPVAMNRPSPSLRSAEMGTTGSPPGPRLLQDSPTPVQPRPTSTSPSRLLLVNGTLASPAGNNISPARLEPMSVSPARPNPVNSSPTQANTKSIRPSTLPNDDQFVLGKRIDGDTTMQVDTHKKILATGQASPTLSTSNLSLDASPTQRTAELPEEVLLSKETNDVDKGPTQDVQMASSSTSVVTRPLETSKGVKKAPENEPTITDAKSKSNELIKAKMEKLMCKSVLASTLPNSMNSSAPNNANNTENAKESSAEKREEASQSNEVNDTAPLSTNIGDQVKDKQQRLPSNNVAILNKPTSLSNGFKIGNENIDDPRKKAYSTNHQSTNSNAEMKEVPIPPTSSLKRPRWQRMINKQPLGSKVDTTEVDGVLSAEGTAENTDNVYSDANMEDINDGDTSRVNGILGEVSSLPAWQGTATSPRAQGLINSDSLLCNKAMEAKGKTPTIAVRSNSTLNKTNCPSMAPTPATESEAKAEDFLANSNAGSTPQPLPIANCTVTKEAKTTYEVKEEDSHGYKNRYFLALETAKTLFFQASHETGGEQVVSNVRCFKAMMELFRPHNELIDRKTVARIVYEKGGMGDALDETLFLEAFSVLYSKVQAVRQRLWSEVYDQAGAEEEGLLVFHARDLVTRECKSLDVRLNPVWNNETLEEVIASYSTDGVLVDRNAFVQAADHIFSI